MPAGSCLCSTVRWRYEGAFERMTHCHCGMCRKSHGTAFATYVIGPRARFQFAAGEEAIVRYESSPKFVRSFCRHCGSVLPNIAFGELMAAPAGGFDGDLGMTPWGHIFSAWKAPWHPINDSLPQHDHYPGADAPAVDREPATPSTAGLLRGSCLCGDVTYGVTGDFKFVHQCHCSRCRKAYAAAHCTNGITRVSNVRFTRGEQHLTTYRFPHSRFYAPTFCRRCGSKMPRLDIENRMALVPFGSLDDDPKRTADDHIYVGSKSSWYSITDDLPQYAELP